MAKQSKNRFPNGRANAQDEFVSLRAEGRSYDQIAEILGVSRQCLQNWSKDLAVEIENAKAFKAGLIGTTRVTFFPGCRRHVYDNPENQKQAEYFPHHSTSKFKDLVHAVATSPFHGMT